MKFIVLLLSIIIVIISFTNTNALEAESSKNTLTKDPIFSRVPSRRFIQTFKLNSKGKGERCFGSIRNSECRKPYYCFRSRCRGQLDYGEVCQWLGQGSMCRQPYQCHKGRCVGNYDLNETCDFVRNGNLCRSPYVCEYFPGRRPMCKIPNNWGCTITSDCLDGSECTSSLVEDKFRKGKVTDLVGYYKTCNSFLVNIKRDEEKNYFEAVQNWKTDPRRCDERYFKKYLGQLLIKKGDKKVFNDGVIKFKPCKIR